jgi:hypothetical protein
LQGEAKTAGFIDGVDLVPALAQPGRPLQEGLLAEALRGLGLGPLDLSHDHVLVLVEIDSELAHGAAAIKLARVASGEAISDVKSCLLIIRRV